MWVYSFQIPEDVYNEWHKLQSKEPFKLVDDEDYAVWWYKDEYFEQEGELDEDAACGLIYQRIKQREQRIARAKKEGKKQDGRQRPRGVRFTKGE